MTPQRGGKGLGLTHWKKDGCWRRVPDAGRPRERAGWVTAGWAAGVCVRGDTCLHLAAWSRPGSVQLIGNELWRQPPAHSGGSRSWSCPAAGAQSPGNAGGKGGNPATALLGTGVWWLLEVTKALKGCTGHFAFHLAELHLSPKATRRQLWWEGRDSSRGWTALLQGWSRTGHLMYILQAARDVPS